MVQRPCSPPVQSRWANFNRTGNTGMAFSLGRVACLDAVFKGDEIELTFMGQDRGQKASRSGRTSCSFRCTELVSYKILRVPSLSDLTAPILIYGLCLEVSSSYLAHSGTAPALLAYSSCSPRISWP